MVHIVHPIEPVYNSSSRVLILGTMPSPKSREAGFYYAHPQNRFWKVLARLFQVEVPIGLTPRKEFALNHGIALWDVLHSCDIEGASDASIKNPVPNDLSRVLSAAPVQAIFCTGKRAGNLYHWYAEHQTGIEAIVLPSTSPANCAVPFERLCEEYRCMLKFLEFNR